MNTREHDTMKLRGSADTSYLGQTVDQMVWEFMKKEQIDGLTLAIVQAPYIPRVVGYGLADAKQRRLASPNTLWPVGPISQAFAAVAVMQLFEDGALGLEDTLEHWLPGVPAAWNGITVLQLLRHAAGLPDYRQGEGFDPARPWSFDELVERVKGRTLRFAPGTDVEQSATNFLLLTEIVERAAGQSYHDFVTERQIRFLGLRHTGFAEDLDAFAHEDVSVTGNLHQRFKLEKLLIDPTEPAASYNEAGEAAPRADSSALRGFGDI